MTPAPSARILVVDDDPGLRELLASYLGANGFAVIGVGDGVAMRAVLAEGGIDAIVLDLMLPGEDGLSLVRAVRATSAMPILMLSARGEELDRIVGLEVGADDYLPKPCAPRELLARLRALLRRSQGPQPTSERKRFGPFELDMASHRLWRDGAEIPLTTAEYQLLEIFITRPNRVLTRDVLVDQLRGFDRDPMDRSIDNRVTRLRRRIEDDPANPAYIRTVRGEGYLFHPQGNEG
ncbi:response regulator [Candidatus Symbiobacter mobilis]|uniref:Response regulator n=1 Tax=Candidatus Symbiobacter mobilis CR TaxID=946483 RepID=U5NDZ8_9BURK|nr:response regulator [Candidatus Symbiobacter mobilis]AGX88443.1 response regulator [Candidatus Symbiobacter mobilis CR]